MLTINRGDAKSSKQLLKDAENHGKLREISSKRKGKCRRQEPQKPT